MANSTVDPAPRLSPTACPACGTIDTPAVGPGSGQHYASARCRHCGRWLAWLSRYSREERQARRQQNLKQAMAALPTTPRQLDYLQALGDRGPVPGSMLEASQRIDTLKLGKVRR